MHRGSEHESMARVAYEAHTGKLIEEAGIACTGDRHWKPLVESGSEDRTFTTSRSRPIAGALGRPVQGAGLKSTKAADLWPPQPTLRLQSEVESHHGSGRDRLICLDL